MRLESKRASIPTLFLEMGDTVAGLLAHPEIERSWGEPSSLEHLSIGALAAHLGRAFTTTWFYLQADECTVDEDVDASTYFYNAFDQPDEALTELRLSIVNRADEDAERGATAVRELHDRTVADLRTKLIGESAERGIEVFGDVCMQLDDYLVTRMVEAVIHADDLCHSLGIDMPEFAPDVVDLVMVALLGMARARHGDVAMLREFARGERATGDRLPVF